MMIFVYIQWSLMAGMVSLWSDWEVQILVLISFMLQVFLLMFARMRRRNISIVPRTLLWLAYLLADAIAIYILGHMSFYGKSHGHQQLMAFWAPFLLVHLGGQDNITAYSIEDNQLWPRHLLSFIVQTVGVAYVLYNYIAGSWPLVIAALLIFVSGVFKYGERVWALKSSSLENMSKFLDSRKLTEAKQGQYAQLDQGGNFDPERDLQGAHDLLPICMAQFVDYKFWPSEFQSKAIALFDNKGQIFELVEMQLSLMYDFLYTKAAVVFTWHGCFIRAISSIASITTFFLFQSSIGQNDFNRVDAIVTYILISGAVLLEMTALLKAVGSTWTCTLLHARGWHRLHNIVLSIRRGVKAAERNRRWSGSIGHPELLNLSHGSGCCAQSLRCKDLWKKLHHSLPVISDATKKLVLEEVRRMVEACEGKEDMMRSYTGQCALNPWHGLFKDPTSHTGIDFDDKIISWYFATKIFFSWSSRVEEHGYVEATTTVSNYMIFLLTEHPYMLPSPVRPGLYARNKEAYVGLDFSEREQISRKLGLNKRRRMSDLDTRMDVDKLHKARGKLDIIREDLDIIRENLDGRKARHERSEELDISWEELKRIWEELDDLRLVVGHKRDKLVVLDKRREELDKKREKLDRGSEELYLGSPPSLGLPPWRRLEELNRTIKDLEQLDRRRSEVDGRREENLDVDTEELNRTMKKLEELDRRSEELHFRSPPSLVRGAELAVWLLEAEMQCTHEVWRVLLGVWVEMLCYASHHCTRDSHARQLNGGGEFITVVWLLSTAMFNRRYCDEDWFKKGVREFFRSHSISRERRDGVDCLAMLGFVLLLLVYMQRRRERTRRERAEAYPLPRWASTNNPDGAEASPRRVSPNNMLAMTS
ncbi:hypothetical protein VPH35_033210 [Triticum aestivum]